LNLPEEHPALSAEKSTTEFVRMTNRTAANPPRDKAAKMREAVTDEFRATDQPTHQKLEQ